jgi:hypothetical protein
MVDDAFGHFLVPITCKYGAQRIAQPEVPSAPVRVVGIP